MAVLGATTLTGCNSIPGFINTGTFMLFLQSSAPTNWTKSTTDNDASLRVVSGTASSGGTANFSATFTTRTPTGTVGGTTLATTQIPSHNHSYTREAGTSPRFFNPVNNYWLFTAGFTSGAEGGSTSHAHPVSVNSLDFNVKYVDTIIASKD